MAQASAVESPTRAMTDVFEAKKKELDDCLDAFSHVSNQKGILVFVNGKVVEFDLISRAAAYEVLHLKLVKSYVMDALLQKKGSRHKATLDDASHFLKRHNRLRKKSSNQQGSAGTAGLREVRLSGLHSCMTRPPFTQHFSGRKVRRTVIEWRTMRDVPDTERGAQYEPAKGARPGNP